MYDVIIIGAGVVGASAARELSKYELDIGVLEARADVAMGSSAANSAIVHAGYDCKPGTLMAELNVKGNEKYEQLKLELDIPFMRNGSLVLAFDEDGVKELERLLKQGEKNGVPGLEILSRHRILEMEPAVNGEVVAALWAPSGGITCPYELTVAMIENAVKNKVKVFLEHPVIDIKKGDDGIFNITTKHGEFKTKYIINCAGVYADEISKMAGDDSFSITPRKGEYILYDRKYGSIVKHTIFQTPGKLGKGVLVTPTVDGNLLIGPSAEDINDKEDKATTQEGLDFVYSKALQSVPSVPRGGSIRTFSGLRAIGSTGDFIIRASRKVHGLIHAAGICSPGLSAAPAIALELVDILQKIEGPLKKKINFEPHRKAIPRFREMDWEQRKQIISKNPAYGRIVCRCETVTEGEIIEAIRRNLPARTIDAVKRRTRAGMGRCQGGFCTPKIMEIMQRELNIPLTDITKFGGQSNIVTNKIKETEEGGQG
jgi:glycerol-3-phosphate dehydrogenase